MSDDHDDDDLTSTITAKVDKEYLEKLQKQREESERPVSARAQKAKERKEALSLERQAHPGERKRREKSKEDIAKEKEDEASNLKIATPAQRVLGGAVDLAITGAMYMAAKNEKAMLMTEEFLFKALEAAGNIKLELSDTILDYMLISMNFIALYFIVQVCVTWIMQKSIGKMVAGTHLVSFEADKVGLFQAIKREMILKPLGTALLIGFIMPFFSDDNESFHDRFGGTIVAKDRK